MSERIKKVFNDKSKKLITFTTAGDPNISTSYDIIKTIINSGTDIIELGMPFSDPMADGPIIQLSSNRAIKAGITIEKIFNLCKKIRNLNFDIPIILMGYYNVIHYFGIKNFVKKCKENEVDGLIIVDLQPEEDDELLQELKKNNIDLIRLIAPTTNEERLKYILKSATGFLYYVTITGITGQNSANINELEKTILEIKKQTSLPIVAGFGIKNNIHVNEICKIADGAVVGSSIVKIIQDNINNNNKLISEINNFTKELKSGTNL